MATRFSRRLSWPAPDNALSRLKTELRARGRTILDFSESNPTRVGLSACRDEAAAELLAPYLDPANLRYDPNPRGLLRARRSLAAHYADRGAPAPEDFFLCASTSEAYGLVFKLLCDPGDAVLVPKPGYPLFDFLAGLEAVEALPYRLEYRHPAGWRVDLDALESTLSADAACRIKALVLINPNNPTGSYVADAEREALVALCARRGVALVCDEVFHPFALETAPPRSFMGEDRVLTFVLDGLSKQAGLPQAKLGWMALSGPPAEAAEAAARMEVIADTYLSAGTPVMNALPALLDHGRRFRSELLPRMTANLATLRSVLEGTDSPHRVLRCGGGWTALIESPRLEGEEALAAGLLSEKGLWSQPGYYFDMERESYFTASLILPPQALAEGAASYRDYFAELLK